MRTRPTRYSILLLGMTALALAVALPAAAAQSFRASKPRAVTVMTRNLYLGADTAPFIAAVTDPNATPETIIAAVSEFWGNVKFTDFPARAEELAREIAAAQPDLIGLQEAELWRSRPAAANTVARRVEYDFVKILVEALKKQGVHFDAVAEETGFDIELPGFLSPEDAALGKLSFIRLTEREVILARRTTELELSNAQTGHFVTNVVFPDLGIVVQRGWASVDASLRGRDFRFVTTHLEADDESVRVAQAGEILAGPAGTGMPVILVADANSNANGDSTSAAYNLFLSQNFVDAWFAANPGILVSTCCADPSLLSPILPIPTDNEGRIDLVLYRGAADFNALGASLFGNDPATDRVFNGVALIWPSDHAGVAATLQVPD
jgi:endonuclease/exonuclease/phosphatase family metal-dependent hydrolase